MLDAEQLTLMNITKEPLNQNKMTAVEWLEETSMRRNLVPGDFEQAKEMEKRKSKLEQLATLLQSAWTNGNWKAETPNEREMEKIMVELGYWSNENEWTLEQRRSMVSKEIFNTFYTEGDPSTLSHEELDRMFIPRYKPTTVPQTIWWEGKISDGEITVTDNNNNPGTVTTMSPTDVENERFKHNASDYNPAVREKDHPAGETTIEFPTPHQPEQYNPNKPSLDWITFKFEQEENCVDGGAPEQLIVEAKSSLGIDGDGGAFYVLKTEQWAISDIDDLIVMLRRVEAAVNATKPTSIHVK